MVYILCTHHCYYSHYSHFSVLSLCHRATVTVTRPRPSSSGRPVGRQHHSTVVHMHMQRIGFRPKKQKVPHTRRKTSPARPAADTTHTRSRTSQTGRSNSKPGCLKATRVQCCWPAGTLAAQGESGSVTLAWQTTPAASFDPSTIAALKVPLDSTVWLWHTSPCCVCPDTALVLCA